MRSSELNDLLDRVVSWPKEARIAAFDALSAIEEECSLREDLSDPLRFNSGNISK
jgi:hypothetical protein